MTKTRRLIYVPTINDDYDVKNYRHQKSSWRNETRCFFNELPTSTCFLSSFIESQYEFVLICIQMNINATMQKYLFLSIILSATTHVTSFYSPPPDISPATGLKNQIFEWRGQKIRYQVSEPSPKKSNKESVILVHGLFVNSDHWRKTLKGLGDEGYTVYALDLLGSGYSSKPVKDSDEAKALNGENNRFVEDDNTGERNANISLKRQINSIVPNVKLGTASGKNRIADVDLRHPLNSCYNFYTWAEQISDFTKLVVLRQNNREKASLVCNSIGTISSLQAVIDTPDLFNGVFVVCPNFRELHSAEVPLSNVAMPVIRTVQKTLRDNGQPLFEALAKPNTVKQILMEPYEIQKEVDDELVDVLLTPLLTKGASDVVFDTLSYSAGPLPEQQLADEGFPKGGKCPVWVCYGTKDPWTPADRVEGLMNFEFGGNNEDEEKRVVEKVVALEGVGHCPHDESPDLVNPLLLDFLDRVKENKESTSRNFFANIFGT